MADVKVQRLPSGTTKISKRELYAMVCYYYPKYSLQDAQNLPARDLNLLLRTAQKIEARKMHDFVLIVAAPYGKNKDTVKNLADHFLKISKD